MKLQVQKLTKEEYKKNYDKYKKTANGKLQINRLLRLLIAGIFLLFYGSYYLIDNYIKSNNTSSYIIPVICIILALTFIISSHKLKIKSLNNFYIKNKNSK